MTVMETTEIRPTNRDGTFSTRDAAILTGATYRQIDYWCRAGILREAQPANGSGSRRAFHRSEIRIIRAVAALRQLGMTVDQAGAAVAELRYLPVEAWTGPWISSGRILSLDLLRG